MKNLFLYRLFKHSRLAFVFVVSFLIFYTVVFYKKIDMVFFPYNGMYAFNFSKPTSTATYAMKLNGQHITITNHLYWKKDFLETSLFGYAQYIMHGQKLFLHDFINRRFQNESIRSILLNRLTPDSAEALNWPRWYILFAGYSIPINSTAEIMKYDFIYEKGRAVLKDSTSIYKTILR